MSRTIKSMSIIVIFLAVLFAFALPCIAAESEGKITVCTEDENKKAVDGLNVSVCKIASISGTDYYPSEEFQDSGISIAGIVNDPSAVNAKTVYDYIVENSITVTSVKTENGKAVFEAVDNGIWLVFCEENGTHKFAPYIVFMPYEQNGKLYYQVNSTPKLEENIPDNKSIYVIKKWEDKNNAAKLRPDSIKITLFKDGNEIESVVLSEACGWAHTFTSLSTDGKYTVKEQSVEHYTSKVSGDCENGFIITNTYNGDKLPQTGQLWWPIVILCIVGGLFVLLGILDIGAQKNGKKK